MRVNRLSILPALFLSGFIFCGTNAKAQESVGSTIKLSDKLNEIGMFDLSFYLLEKEMAKNPQDKDTFIVQKAATWFRKGKVEEGEKLLNTIRSSSSAYPFSRMILGIKFVNQGENEKAAKVLEEYFAYMKTHKPDPDDAEAIGEFQKAVAYLKFAYVKLGDSDNATKAVERMKWVQPNGGGPENEHQNVLLACTTKLDTVENMIELKEKGWESMANSVLKPLAELYWAGAYLSAMAAVQRARAFYLLGRYDDGMKDLRKYGTMIKGFDQSFKSQGIFEQAPSAQAKLWKGFLYIGIAEQTKSKRERLMLYKKAAGKFVTIFKKYNMDKFPYTDKAVAGFYKVKAAIKKLGKTLKLPRGIHLPGGKVNSREANQMYAKKEYAKAIPKYLALLRNPKITFSDKAPDLLYRLIDCYTKTGSELEPLALAGYLGEIFPNDTKYTPVTLLQVGERNWKKYTDAKEGSKEKNDYLDNAMYVYKIYLKSCPTHEFAPDIAIRMAQVQFDRANNIAKNAKKAPTLAEKLQMVQEARVAFTEAIPMYEYIVNNYANSKRGKTSAYLLAICETSAKNYQKGAELFEQYINLERNWKKQKEQEIWRIGDAQLRAAQNYFDLAESLRKESKSFKKKSEKAPSVAHSSGAKSVKVDPEKIDATKENANKSAENKANADEAAPVDKVAATEKTTPVEVDKKAATEKIETEDNAKAVEKIADKAKAEDANNNKLPEIEETPEAVIERIKEPRTKEDYLALAKAKLQLSEQFYKLSLKKLEQLQKWLAPGGLVSSDHSKKAKEKLPKITERTASLIGWAYDGANETDKAIDAFSEFITKFPNSKLIPKSMLRLGMLYLSKEETTKAAEVLDELSAKFPEEGKKALPKLARALYETGKFKKSIETETKILNDKQASVPISHLRWVAKNLQDCDGKHPKEGAELSLKAVRILLEEIKSPVLKDWFGVVRGKQMEGKTGQITKELNRIKEQLYMIAGQAAYYAAEFKESVDYLSLLLDNGKTPYFWDAHFLRAEAYMQLKKFSEAIEKDFAEMSMTYLSLKNPKTSIYYKIQCKIGDCYIGMQEYGKAISAYNSVVLALMAPDVEEDEETPDEKKIVAPEEKIAENQWMEYALFMNAACDKKLGNDEDVEKLVGLYKKHFVMGKYASQLSNLPSPDDVYKKNYTINTEKK